MEIVNKTARDGRTPIIIGLEAHRRPTTDTTYVLVVYYGGQEIAKMENSRPQLMEPIGDLTHGLIVGPNGKSVGLTSDEAQRINAAVDAWRAEYRQPADPVAVEAAIAAFHCRACGRRLGDLDIEITALEGYHPDCV